MNELRTAAQQALEALGNAEYGAYDAKELNEAITALRSALAEPTVPSDCADSHQPVQEPVAWRYVPSDVWGDAIVTQDPKTVELAQEYRRPVEPLYTAPPQRKPLTDEEIVEIAVATQGLSDFAFARAIERAHGIGGQA